jgi:phosphoadenosine phosphosulfate reductase
MTPAQITQANAELRDQPPQDIVKWAVGPRHRLHQFPAVRGGGLHLCTQVQPDMPVLWVDHGYNRPATYQHAESCGSCSAEPEAVPAAYERRASRRHSRADPTRGRGGAEEFSALMKLEPFQRGMKELAPTVWITALRKVQNPEPRRLDIVSRTRISARSRSVPCSTGATRTWRPTSQAAQSAQRMGLFRSGEGRRETRMRPARRLGRRKQSANAFEGFSVAAVMFR